MKKGSEEARKRGNQEGKEGKEERRKGGKEEEGKEGGNKGKEGKEGKRMEKIEDIEDSTCVLGSTKITKDIIEDRMQHMECRMYKIRKAECR